MPISSRAYARLPLLPRPISTTLTLLSRPCAPAGWPAQLPDRRRPAGQLLASPAAVVRRLGHHLDVVRVTLHQPGARDLREPGLLQIGDRPGPAVAHGRPQAAGELVRYGRQRPAVGHLALDALRDQLVLAQYVVLEVA